MTGRGPWEFPAASITGDGPPAALRWVVAAAIVAAFVVVGMRPAGAQEPEGSDVRWDSDTCLECHDGDPATLELPSGEVLGRAIDGEAFRATRHTAIGVQCVHCHTTIARYPHPDLTVPDLRTFRVELSKSCSQCHWREFTIKLDQAHALIASSELGDLPVCADCHNPHAARGLTSDHPEMRAKCWACHPNEASELTIHALDPTEVQEASAPPLIIFFLLITLIVVVVIAVAWGGVVAVQWAGRRVREAR